MTDHAMAAQRAAERALEAAENGLAHDDPDIPYDGCATCVVRVVLEAAYPHLRALAIEDANEPPSPTATGAPTTHTHEGETHE